MDEKEKNPMGTPRQWYQLAVFGSVSSVFTSILDSEIGGVAEEATIPLLCIAITGLAVGKLAETYE